MNQYFVRFARIKVVSLLLLALLWGCVQQPKKMPEKPALLLTSFQKNILGHWVTETGRTHYYVGAGTIVMVDGTEPKYQTYTIYETNEADRIMKIEVTTEHNMGHRKSFKFSADFKSISETASFDVMGRVGEVTTVWNFVDSKVAP